MPCYCYGGCTRECVNACYGNDGNGDGTLHVSAEYDMMWGKICNDIMYGRKGVDAMHDDIKDLALFAGKYTDTCHGSAYAAFGKCEHITGA